MNEQDEKMYDEIIITEMTKEDLEQLELEHKAVAFMCGFTDSENFENFKVDASLGMIRFGGGFTHHLGHALAHADYKNTAKIIKAFPGMCAKHALLHKKFMEERNKPKEEV